MKAYKAAIPGKNPVSEYLSCDFITLAKENLEKEHICCAFSDKKCSEGYEMKKAWLRQEFDNGYVFRRLDARAKVFIEYVPAEKAWIPVSAPGYLMIGCLWVSGQEKNIPLTVIKLETMEQAQACPSPATIFSAFYNGKFLTTDMSICTESKFQKMFQ